MSANTFYHGCYATGAHALSSCREQTFVAPAADAAVGNSCRVNAATLEFGYRSRAQIDMRLMAGSNRYAYSGTKSGVKTLGKRLVYLIACAADAWAYCHAYIPRLSAQTRHLHDSRSQYAVI